MTLDTTPKDNSAAEPQPDTSLDIIKYKKYKPWNTILFCIVSLVLFIGINTEADLNSWEAFRRWGAPSPNDIWNGDLWGLLTSNFLHEKAWHLVFNLYWMWVLGKKLEYELPKPYFLGLTFSSGIISSIAQLAISDTTGIGLSGIVYAYFGYIFIRARKEASYKNFLDKRTIQMFLVWLVLCIVLTHFNIWTVGNAGHIGGIVWGMLLAWLAGTDSITLKYGLPSALLCLAFIPVFAAPWSVGWLCNKAYLYHASRQIKEAKVLYNQVLNLDPGNEYATQNLKAIKVEELQTEAYNAHAAKDYKRALKLYNELLQMDSTNAWAKENKARLGY